MAYYCTDCSYRGVKSGQLGECPACGSFKITKAAASKKKEPSSRIRLTILALLWTYLIALIAWKLYS
jgi:predicted ATP-dependent serine protease